MVGFQESCEHVKHRGGLLPLVIVMRCPNQQISRYPESYPRPSRKSQLGEICAWWRFQWVVLALKELGKFELDPIWLGLFGSRLKPRWKPATRIVRFVNFVISSRHFPNFPCGFGVWHNFWFLIIGQEKQQQLARSWFMICWFSRINFNLLHIDFLVPLVLFVFMLYHFLSVWFATLDSSTPGMVWMFFCPRMVWGGKVKSGAH